MSSQRETPGGLIGLVRGLVLALGFLGLLLPRTALAGVSEAEAASKIEQTYGVRALKVRGAEFDGRKVWMVTVMNPPGDSNEAFQVNTLAVDQESGELVPAFHHKTSGYELSGGLLRDDKVGRAPDAIRSRVWR